MLGIFMYPTVDAKVVCAKNLRSAGDKFALEIALRVAEKER